MNLRSRILGDVNVPAKEADNSPKTQKTESDLVVILAGLLCALICVLGLIVTARCAWIRRISGRITTPPPAANKGLKNKVLKSIPKLAYTGGDVGKFTDCAICLAEFVAGDEIRVLPPCGHGFHVGCIDTWLRSHSSCPSCRQLLVAATCRKCGGMPGSSVAGAETQEGRLEQRRQDDVNGFLP
ncbi:RING-H2 finger protein ATL80-like [Actinidia eriantha]|uniref:RING-H2 finger protein ATL80-like n=1 Tax=Actinidia eriantha TaxID=165200 RepID=UPI002590F610|nr:RING-H2 finger protein ATL80-like [Actinidia eriantha]